MSYSPPGVFWPRVTPDLFSIGVGSPEALGLALPGLLSVASTNQNYPVVNTAIYIPFGLASPFTVQQFGICNGTAVAGNIDIGVYSAAGARLASCGSTAQAGTSVIQWINATAATVLLPGRYYLAISSNTSGATQKVFGWVCNAAQAIMFGLKQSSDAPPLPASPTLATPGAGIILVPSIYLSARTVN